MLPFSSMSNSGLGGIKEVIALISGRQVYSRLKHESGVHRVQRVPATEAQGRIHTSTATVAVLRGELDAVVAVYAFEQWRASNAVVAIAVRPGRLVTVARTGTGVGSVLSFQTPAAPTVTTAAATGIQGSGWAVLSWDPIGEQLIIQQLFDRSQYQSLIGLLEIQGQTAMMIAGGLGGLLVDRVPLWATINEPWVIVDGGYLHGSLAPGHRSDSCGSARRGERGEAAELFEFTKTFITSPIMFLIVLNLFLIIVGMMMDIFSAIIVVVPLIIPIAMEEGLRFAIREGGRTVGAGVVAKILK